MRRTDTHVRIPPDLHSVYKARARALGVSLNALVTLTLRAAIKASADASQSSQPGEDDYLAGL